MPIFMDRHELAGTSAADITAAHLKELNIQGSVWRQVFHLLV